MTRQNPRQARAARVETKKPATGRPPFEPSAEQRAHVQRLRLAGATLDVIAAIIGVSVPTLRLRFSADLEHSTSDLMGNIADILCQAALGGNVAAAMFVLRTRGGWVERQEVAGAASAPGLPPLSLPVVMVAFEGDPAYPDPADDQSCRAGL